VAFFSRPENLPIIPPFDFRAATMRDILPAE
jgi:hypothetical protein